MQKRGPVVLANGRAYYWGARVGKTILEVTIWESGVGKAHLRVAREKTPVDPLLVNWYLIGVELCIPPRYLSTT